VLGFRPSIDSVLYVGEQQLLNLRIVFREGGSIQIPKIVESTGTHFILSITQRFDKRASFQPMEAHRPVLSVEVH